MSALLWRITLWLYFLSVAVLCFLLAGYLWVLHEVFRDWFRRKPLPALTDSVIDWRFYLLFLPLPWLGGAVWLSRRNGPPAAAISLYGAAVLLLGVLLITLALIASALPFIWQGSLQSP